MGWMIVVYAIVAVVSAVGVFVVLVSREDIEPDAWTAMGILAVAIVGGAVWPLLLLGPAVLFGARLGWRSAHRA